MIGIKGSDFFSGISEILRNLDSWNDRDLEKLGGLGKTLRIVDYRIEILNVLSEFFLDVTL